MGFIVLLNALLNALLLATQAAEGAFTDHLLVQLHEDAQDEAHQLAAQHGFQSARKVEMRGENGHALLALYGFKKYIFLLRKNLKQSNNSDLLLSINNSN